MLSLRSLQSSFAAHLFEDEPESIIPWIRSDGIDPVARLRIYRNNLHEGFQKTLALEYPVIGRLVGNEYFRQLALAFLACHPSTSGDLHHVGAPFAAFLRSSSLIPGTCILRMWQPLNGLTKNAWWRRNSIPWIH